MKKFVLSGCIAAATGLFSPLASSAIVSFDAGGATCTLPCANVTGSGYNFLSASGYTIVLDVQNTLGGSTITFDSFVFDQLSEEMTAVSLSYTGAFSLSGQPMLQNVDLSAPEFQVTFFQLEPYQDEFITLKIGTNYSPIPEPASLALFALGIAGLAYARKQAK